MTVVEVTGHAVDRARQRQHFASLDGGELARLIEREVADAIDAGRASKTKPAWTKLITRHEMHQGMSRRGTELPFGERFVWNAGETLGWVVKHEPGRVVVVTSLHRVRSAGAYAA